MEYPTAIAETKYGRVEITFHGKFITASFGHLVYAPTCASDVPLI